MLDEEDVSQPRSLIEEYSSYAYQRPHNRFCHEREVHELPERFHDRLPHRARLAYLSDVYYDLDLETYCTFIASNPRKLKRGKAIRLTLDDASALCQLLSTPDAPQYVIRCAPAYFLSTADQRGLSVDNLSYVDPLPPNFEALKVKPRKDGTYLPRPVERETAEFEAASRGTAGDGGESSLCFDIFYFVCLNQYTYNAAGERLQMVEASAFADRLTGRRTGRVKRIWLTEEQIHQALLWSQDLDAVDGYTRRLRVNTYVLQQGAKAPTPKELTHGQETPQYTTFYALSRQVFLRPEDLENLSTGEVLKAVKEAMSRYQLYPHELQETMAFLRRQQRTSRNVQEKCGQAEVYDHYSDLLLSEDEAWDIQYWVIRLQSWYHALLKGHKEPCLVTHELREVVDGESRCVGYSVLIGIPTTFRAIPHSRLIIRPQPKKTFDKPPAIKKHPRRNLVADRLEVA